MEYKHFSHKHNLGMYQVQQGQQLRCSGCESLCDNSIYACWQCNFFLHDHCGNASRYVNHPAHPSHPLVLSPYPTYTGGSFLCNACGAIGNAFSYCCALCEVDLHVHCAFLPPKVTHKAHSHDLILSHGNENASIQACKICSKQIDSKHWSYRCSKLCNHWTHTFCATAEVKMGLYMMDDSSDPPPAATSASTAAAAATPPPQAEEEEVELTEEEAYAFLRYQLQMLALSNAGSYV